MKDGEKMPDKSLTMARQKAAEILKEVVANKITSKEARSKWPDYKGDPSLDAAFHLLYHFEDDEDIRDRDTKYSEWQMTQFREIIESFEHGNELNKNLIRWGTPTQFKKDKKP
jgi:hypothetical protein